MRKNDLDIFAVVGACVVGTLIGLGVGLMVAPQSGDDLREKIASKGRDIYKKAKSRKDQFEDDFEDFKYDFEDSLDDGIDEVKDILD